MFDINYGKLINTYPQYLRLPVQLTADITINGVVHPAGSWLSTDDEGAILELGYKTIIRTDAPTKEGFYYTDKWTDTGAAIVQEWEEHEIPEDPLADAVTALETLGYTEVENG